MISKSSSEKEVLRKHQKKEALRRMDVLGFLPEVKKDFKKEDILYYSATCGYIPGVLYWVTNKPEYAQLIQEYEQKTDNLVYHVELTHSIFGDLLTLLYVSQYENKWSVEYEELKQGYPLCYVINISDETCSEYGVCQITSCNGGIKRIG